MRRHAHLGAEKDASLASRSRPTAEIVRRVAPYLWPYKWQAAAMMGCALLSLACAFVYPKLTQHLIDGVLTPRRMDLLAPAMIGLLGAFFLRDLLNSLRILVNNHFEQNVIFDMRREIFAKLQRLPAGWFDQRSSGDLMTRVIEDVNSVERVLIDGTEQGTVSLLSIVGVLYFMFHTNATLAWVALAPLPLLAAGALAYSLTAHHRYRGQREASSAMNALLMDNLQGIRQIKAFAREEHEDARFGGRADELRRGTLGVMRVWAIYSPAMSFLNAAGIALVLWVGGHQVLEARMTVGELVGFVFFLNLFYEPVGRLHGLNQMLQAARAAGERVFDILDATPEAAGSARTASSPVRLRGEVVYRAVGFGYAPGGSVLNDINLQASPGQMIALVGPTGAGKSTIVNLLPRFYELTAGDILVDGTDVRKLPLAVLRSQISVVSQEPFLFNGTIRENILYGRLEASEEEMTLAAKAANCHEFISLLPQGYDSRVGERGVKLSVGEKQRVSIARALLKDSPILVLDEATASVDTETERLIQEALERLMKGRTTFVIAHRLSTVRRADQILVIRQGRIIERGNHQELSGANGLYARLSRIQNTSTVEEMFQKIDDPLGAPMLSPRDG